MQLDNKDSKLTLYTNNCEKVGNDVINILTGEDMENMYCSSLGCSFVNRINL